MTLASAPSIPAIAIITLAFIIASIWFISLCIPATPTSYSLTTSLPYTSAVLAASSATGISLVPPVATTILPLPFFSGISPIIPICDNLS